MAKIRGTSILGTLQYARETFGEEALKKVLAGLTGAARGALGDGATTPIVTTGWYDCALVSDLTREVERLETKVNAMILAICVTVLTEIYKTLVR